MWSIFGLILALIPLLDAQAIVAPYQVAIRSNNPTIIGSIGSSKQICNGVIIRDKYVLTTGSCVHFQDAQTKQSRLIAPGDIFVIAGNISMNQTDYGDEVKGSFRRNVVSVIPNWKFNASTGDNDIAILKLDRSLLPLANNTSPVRWIELEQHPQQRLQPQPAQPATTPSQQVYQTTTTASTNNKVNENCFINIYNNSVGVSDYPYNAAKNVSFFQKWVCDAQRGSFVAGQTVAGRNETCIEYRFSNVQSCWLDANTLRRSEERGTALVCNFKLVAILTEINPPANPQSCTSLKRTTAYYSMVAPYYDWIVSEIGYLYNSAPVSQPGPNGTMTGSPVPSGPAPPISSWGDQQIATTTATTPATGKTKSTAAPSISSGIVFKLIAFNLFIPFALVYRFHH
ncbi:uncharacterized protein LOC109416195 [Aedes albopictus]|uniref:Peptidase S1 domain-containing protein n=1 Tax=Aedes albopictus TaxID=7160 RepID=A0ABM1YIE7_AEDAL